MNTRPTRNAQQEGRRMEPGSQDEGKGGRKRQERMKEYKSEWEKDKERAEGA